MDNEKIGIVVKRRDDELFIIPEEILAQYKVAPEKVAELQAQYDSDVEGQSIPGMNVDDSRWVVGDDNPKKWLMTVRF